jgi:hypothetical protein
MWHLCAGCRQPLSDSGSLLKCKFCDTGFQIGPFKARPCLTRYHDGCVRIGLPFTTRLPKDGGLSLPKDAACFSHFICEACTVRSVTKREIARCASDTVLLMLERARIVDTANQWSKGTLTTYQSKFRIIREFEESFGFSFLLPAGLSHPPNGPSIRLMWVQERYSLIHPSGERRRPP